MQSYAGNALRVSLSGKAIPPTLHSSLRAHEHSLLLRFLSWYEVRLDSSLAINHFTLTHPAIIMGEPSTTAGDDLSRTFLSHSFPAGPAAAWHKPCSRRGCSCTEGLTGESKPATSFAKRVSLQQKLEPEPESAPSRKIMARNLSTVRLVNAVLHMIVCFVLLIVIRYALRMVSPEETLLL